MINIFMQLKNKNDLSHSERIIANYILENPNKVLKMNTKQLSQECFVSSATIYRLCEKLNLSGLSELKVKISSSLNAYLKDDTDFDFDFPIKQNQTHYEIIEKIKEDYEQTLVSTSNLFSLDHLRHAVNAIKRAKHIDIYTSAGNIHLAENFKFQMKEIGVDVNVPIDEYHQRLSAATGDHTHLAIIISFGGRALLSEVLPRILHDRQTPILLISSYVYDFKDKSADYHLYISPYENHYRKISSFSTRLSILYILDILYTCYFELDYDENIEKKLNYYHIMGKAGRY